MVSSTTSTSQSTGKQKHSLPTCFKTKEERNLESIKKFALQILGRGYDLMVDPGEELQQHTLQATDQGNVEIINARIEEIYEVDTSGTSITEKLKKKFQGKVNFRLPFVQIGGQPGYEPSKEVEQKTSKVFFAIVYTEWHHCRFKQIPPKDTNVLGYRKIGDAFVEGAWIYTGFKIYIELDIQLLLSSTRKKFNLDTGVSLGNLTTYIDRISKRVEDKHIINIKLIAEGIGDYTIPETRLSSKKKLKEINEVIKKIKSDYEKNKHRIKIRSFYIDPNTDITSYEKTPDNVAALRGINRTPYKKDFRKLASRIDSQKQLNQLLQGDSLFQLLQRIEMTFEKLFEKEFEKGIALGSKTLFLGATGSGKSTAIAYLSKAKVKMREKLLGKSKKIVADFQGENLPAAGALNSTTRGAEIYSNFIDTAGLFDTGGFPAELCNAIAIDIMVKHFMPNSLVLIVNKSAFENRCRFLLDIIEKLHTITLTTSKEEIVYFSLFLINHKQTKRDQKPYTQKEAIADLDNAIEITEAELETLCSGLTPEDRALWNTLISDHDNIDKKEIHDFDPSIGKKYEELILLKMIKETDSILAIDFTNDSSRERILKRIKEKSFDDKGDERSSLSISMGNLIPNSSNIFRRALKEIARYFNDQVLKKNSLEEELSLFDQSSALETLERKLILVKRKISYLENEKRKLIQDPDKKTFLMDLTQPIRPRTKWEIIAPKYHFKADIGTAINHVELVTPRKVYDCIKRVGSFKHEDTSQLKQGKYSVIYKTGWFGFRHEVDARVKLYVNKSDHPDINSLLSSTTKELYGDRDLHLDGLIAKKRRLIHRIEALKGRIEEDVTQKISQDSTFQKMTTAWTQTCSELDTYKNFCILISKLIKELGYISDKNTAETIIFKTFLHNFDLDSHFTDEELEYDSYESVGDECGNSPFVDEEVTYDPGVTFSGTSYSSSFDGPMSSSSSSSYDGPQIASINRQQASHKDEKKKILKPTSNKGKERDDQDDIPSSPTNSPTSSVVDLDEDAKAHSSSKRKSLKVSLDSEEFYEPALELELDIDPNEHFIVQNQ